MMMKTDEKQLTVPSPDSRNGRGAVPDDVRHADGGSVPEPGSDVDEPRTPKGIACAAVRRYCMGIQNGSDTNVQRLHDLHRLATNDISNDPAAWMDVISIISTVSGWLPDSSASTTYGTGRIATPSRTEKAVGTALGLYAMRINSKNRAPYAVGVRPGAAAAMAIRHGVRTKDWMAQQARVLSRLNSTSDMLPSLRSIVMAMDGIGMDYGLLAMDLIDIDSGDPSRRNAVLASWARAYNRAKYGKSTDKDSEVTD